VCSLENENWISTCVGCVTKNGPTLSQLKVLAKQLDCDGPKVINAALVFLCSTWTGPDEDRIAKITKIHLEEITVIANRLRESEVWKDGKICYDKHDENDPHQTEVMFILMILCANGEVRRVSENTEVT
jgi:hypothetical protein